MKRPDIYVNDLLRMPNKNEINLRVCFHLMLFLICEESIELPGGSHSPNNGKLFANIFFFVRVCVRRLRADVATKDLSTFAKNGCIGLCRILEPIFLDKRSRIWFSRWNRHQSKDNQFPAWRKFSFSCGGCGCAGVIRWIAPKKFNWIKMRYRTLYDLSKLVGHREAFRFQSYHVLHSKFIWMTTTTKAGWPTELQSPTQCWSVENVSKIHVQVHLRRLGDIVHRR